MPLTLFGRPIGTPSAATNSGMRKPTLIGRNATASKSAGKSANVVSPNRNVGRTGASARAATNAGADVFVPFPSAAGLGAGSTQPLPDDADFIGINFNLTVSAASATATTDLLTAIALVEIIGPDGPIIDMVPNVDFYMLFQRFSEYGRVISVTNVASATVTTSATASYYIPLNLPAAKGPYTLILTNATSYAGAATITVSGSYSLVIGTCANRTRYKGQQALPFTVSANATNDLAPLASIQNVPLEELFFSGLTSNTADINYIQVQSAGSTVGPRVLGSVLQSRDQAALNGTLPSTQLFPLLALGTQLTLGRSAHLYITWGANPSSTILVSYYWFD